jgi:hypothetical protein
LRSFDEVDVLGKHDELQYVAADPTSEATPCPRAWKDDQVGPTPVSVKWAPAYDDTALTFEFDAVARDNVLDGVRLFERGCVDPRRLTR